MAMLYNIANEKIAVDIKRIVEYPPDALKKHA